MPENEINWEALGRAVYEKHIEEMANHLIRVLDLAKDAYVVTQISDLPTLNETRWAEEIKALYGRYRNSMSFTEAAFRSRMEVVTRILQGEIWPMGPKPSGTQSHASFKPSKRAREI